MQVQEELWIGRGFPAETAMRLADGNASREHARIYKRDGGTWLEDLGSTNGTWLNGVTARDAEIKDGDIIRIADTILLISAAPPLTSPAPEYVACGIVACSPELCAVLGTAAALVKERIPILLRGPTGAGKEVLAHFIHRRSARTGKLQSVNCAGMPDALMESELFGSTGHAYTGAIDKAGHVEAADKGTLFLDELTQLTHCSQARLLRLLQDNEYCRVGSTVVCRADILLVAATNLSMEGCAKALREDIQGRVEGGLLDLSGLAARRADIIPLAFHFVRLHNRKPLDVLDTDTVERMLLADWPRNVRQLHSVLRLSGNPIHVIAMMQKLGVVYPKDEQAARSAMRGRAVHPFPTKRVFENLFIAAGGNVTLVAGRLRVPRKWVYDWADHVFDGRENWPKVAKQCPSDGPGFAEGEPTISDSTRDMPSEPDGSE